MLSEIGIRDLNGKMIFVGDTVRVVYWDRRETTGTVNYNPAIAAFCVGAEPIYALGRDKGTTLEVTGAPLEGAKPLSKRRRGVSS